MYNLNPAHISSPFRNHQKYILYICSLLTEALLISFDPLCRSSPLLGTPTMSEDVVGGTHLAAHKCQIRQARGKHVPERHQARARTGARMKWGRQKRGVSKPPRSGGKWMALGETFQEHHKFKIFEALALPVPKPVPFLHKHQKGHRHKHWPCPVALLVKPCQSSFEDAGRHRGIICPVTFIGVGRSRVGVG